METLSSLISPHAPKSDEVQHDTICGLVHIGVYLLAVVNCNFSFRCKRNKEPILYLTYICIYIVFARICLTGKHI